MIISNIYKRAFNVLSKMPFKLWGLSLLSSLLTILVLVFGVLPIVIVPVIAVLSAGMAAVYLDGFNGKEVYSDQLFKGFKDFWRTAGGMCWKKLWIFIWFLVPIAGPFIAISKYYAYSFTPYILNEEKSVNATAALRKSMQDTNGYKLQMFCAEFIPNLLIYAVMAILALLSKIPFVGILFAVITVIVQLVYTLFAPLFFGLVHAGFYEYAKTPVKSTIYSSPQAPQTPQAQSAPVQTQTTEQAAPTENNTPKPITCPVCDSVPTTDARWKYVHDGWICRVHFLPRFP